MNAAIETTFPDFTSTLGEAFKPSIFTWILVARYTERKSIALKKKLHDVRCSSRKATMGGGIFWVRWRFQKGRP